jgi:ABC-type transport system substrate-binding protein
MYSNSFAQERPRSGLLSRSRLVTILAVAVAIGMSSVWTAAAGTAATSKGTVDTKAAIRMTYPFIPSTLDPQRPQNANALSWSALLYDSLLTLDAHHNPQPGLASAYQVSKDGLTYSFTLRSGVKFNDGTPFDATAVKTSIERGQKITNAILGSQLTGVNVTVVDPTHVQMTLPAPNATFLYSMASDAGFIVSPAAILQNKDLTTYGDAGTGPYSVTQFQPGTKVVYQRRAGGNKYWGNDSWRVGTLDFTLVTDTNAALNGVRSGQFDLVYASSATFDTVQQAVQGNPDLAVTFVPGAATRSLVLRATNPHFAIPDVRKAIGQAIDSKTIVNTLMKPHAYSPQAWQKPNPGYLSDFKPVKYDPKAAKDAIDKNGGPFSFTVLVQAASPELIWGQAAKEALDKIGVTMNLQPVLGQAALTGFQAGQADAVLATVSAVPDPLLRTQTTMVGQLALFAGTPDLAQLKALLATGNTQPLGSDKRATSIDDVSRFIATSNMIYPFAQIRVPWVHHPNFSGLENPPNGNQWDARHWVVMKK